MSSHWCISSDSPFLSHAHVCVPWLSVTLWSLQFSSPLHCALCVLCVMVLGVPDAIIPEHSQAEPGGWFPPIIVISNGQPGKGERGACRKRVSPKQYFTLWFCPWEWAAKASMLYFMLDILMYWESKNRNKLPDSEMQVATQGKKNPMDR